MARDGVQQMNVWANFPSGHVLENCNRVKKQKTERKKKYFNGPEQQMEQNKNTKSKNKRNHHQVYFRLISQTQLHGKGIGWELGIGTSRWSATKQKLCFLF